MTRPTYVGELEAVRIGPRDLRTVARCALGVLETGGLVTAPTREALEAGDLDDEPRDPVAWPLEAVYYRRRRAEADRWVHETPGAYVHLSRTDPPAAWLSSVGSYRCDGPGDFVCELEELEELEER